MVKVSRALRGIVLGTTLLLMSCGSPKDLAGEALVVGDQYQYYNCDLLIGNAKIMISAEKKLNERMAKGNSQFANVFGGYQLDYANQHGNLLAMLRAARNKNCKIPPELAADLK